MWARQVRQCMGGWMRGQQCEWAWVRRVGGNLVDGWAGQVGDVLTFLTYLFFCFFFRKIFQVLR